MISVTELMNLSQPNACMALWLIEWDGEMPQMSDWQQCVVVLFHTFFSVCVSVWVVFIYISSSLLMLGHVPSTGETIRGILLYLLWSF